MRGGEVNEKVGEHMVVSQDGFWDSGASGGVVSSGHLPHSYRVKVVAVYRSTLQQEEALATQQKP